MQQSSLVNKPGPPNVSQHYRFPKWRTLASSYLPQTPLLCVLSYSQRAERKIDLQQFYKRKQPLKYRKLNELPIFNLLGNKKKK